MKMKSGITAIGLIMLVVVIVVLIAIGFLLPLKGFDSGRAFGKAEALGYPNYNENLVVGTTNEVVGIIMVSDRRYAFLKAPGIPAIICPPRLFSLAGDNLVTNGGIYIVVRKFVEFKNPTGGECIYDKILTSQSPIK